MDSSTPPPIPPQLPGLPTDPPEWRPDPNAPVMLDRQVVSGTEGLTLADVQEEVLKGGRFVIYTYVFSVLVMTFRRSSSICFLRSYQDGAGKAFGYSFLSLLVGPWGFPWGLIWTPACIFTNLSGGKDVTFPVLEAFLGSDEAARTVSLRRKHTTGWGMITARTAFIFAPLILIASFFLDNGGGKSADLESMNSPGYAPFNAAHNKTAGSQASGNTPEAKIAATMIAKGMKEYLDEFSTSAGSKAPSHACGVWCEMREDRCVVIMRVPDLRSYDSKSRNILADAAWMDSRMCLQSVPGNKSNFMLHVAVRGDTFYDLVMMGPLTQDTEAKPSARFGAKEGRRQLIEWFTPGKGSEAERAKPEAAAKPTI